MNPALLSSLEQQATHTAGGNLARVTHASSSQEGHFLFMPQQLKKLLRQFTDAARVARCSGSDSAPAAPPTVLSSRVPQALPFRKVNYLTHVPVSRCETLFNRSAFA